LQSNSPQVLWNDHHLYMMRSDPRSAQYFVLYRWTERRFGCRRKMPVDYYQIMWYSPDEREKELFRLVRVYGKETFSFP